jgi:hypothetical protein
MNRTNSRDRYIRALFVALILALALPTVVLAEGPMIDGQFADWEGYGFVTDPTGDGPTPNTDLTSLVWASLPNLDYIAFLIVRAQPTSGNPKVFYNVYVDGNNNGNIGESVDRRILIEYDPRQNDSVVTVTIFTGSGSQVSQRSGDWGQSASEGGQMCEFLVSFADLGIHGHQTISMYITAGANAGGGNVDRLPNGGSITWTPIPTLGWALTAILLAGGVGVVWYTRGRRVWANT